MTTERQKPWLLQTPEERELSAASGRPNGLLAAGLYSAMQNNQELRNEVLKLEKNLTDAVELIGILNAKIALLATLQKHGTSQNPTATTDYNLSSDWNERDI